MVKLFLLVISLILSLTACEKKYDDLGLKYNYHVYSYFIVNKTICLENPLFIKKIFNPEIPLSQQNVFVDNAHVILNDLKKDVFYELEYADSSKYVLNETDFYFNPNNEYRVDIFIDDVFITANTITPSLSDIYAPNLSDEDGVFPGYQYHNLSQAPVFINCPIGEQRIVFIESYCLELFENAKYIHSFGGISYPSNEEDYEDFLTGFPRRNTWAGVYTPNPDNSEEFIVFNTLNILCYFFGKYRFSVFVVDENYYNYVYKNNGWEEGGIVNAYGVLGSGYGKDFYFEILE